MHTQMRTHKWQIWRWVHGQHLIRSPSFEWPIVRTETCKHYECNLDGFDLQHHKKIHHKMLKTQGHCRDTSCGHVRNILEQSGGDKSTIFWDHLITLGNLTWFNNDCVPLVANYFISQDVWRVKKRQDKSFFLFCGEAACDIHCIFSLAAEM